MRLFLDSADVRLWRRYAPLGVLWGVTTNPLILKRDGVPCTLEALGALADEAAAAAAAGGLRELQLQAWGGGADALLESALRLLDLGAARCPGGFITTVKLPCTADGLAAAAALRRARPGASITVTAVYAAHQALLARAAGADYVAPYLGRMGDALGADAALCEVAAMQAAMRAGLAPGDGYGAGAGSHNGAQQQAPRPPPPPPRVLVASIRAASQMAELAARGCDTFTFAPGVFEEMLTVPSTLSAAAEFEAAAAVNDGGGGGGGARVRVV